MHCLAFRPRTPWWRGLQSNQPHGQQNKHNISIPRFEDPGGLFPPLKTRRYRPRHNNNVRWHTAYGIPDPCRVRRCDITRIRVPATMTLRDPRSCQATLTGLSLRFLKLSSTNSTENRNSLIHLKLTWLSYQLIIYFTKELSNLSLSLSLLITNLLISSNTNVLSCPRPRPPVARSRRTRRPGYSGWISRGPAPASGYAQRHNIKTGDNQDFTPYTVATLRGIASLLLWHYGIPDPAKQH